MGCFLYQLWSFSESMLIQLYMQVRYVCIYEISIAIKMQCNTIIAIRMQYYWKFYPKFEWNSFHCRRSEKWRCHPGVDAGTKRSCQWSYCWAIWRKFENIYWKYRSCCHLFMWANLLYFNMYYTIIVLIFYINFLLY